MKSAFRGDLAGANVGIAVVGLYIGGSWCGTESGNCRGWALVKVLCVTTSATPKVLGPLGPMWLFKGVDYFG